MAVHSRSPFERGTSFVSLLDSPSGVEKAGNLREDYLPASKSMSTESLPPTLAIPGSLDYHTIRRRSQSQSLRSEAEAATQPDAGMPRRPAFSISENVTIIDNARELRSLAIAHGELTVLRREVMDVRAEGRIQRSRLQKLRTNSDRADNVVRKLLLSDMAGATFGPEPNDKLLRAMESAEHVRGELSEREYDYNALEDEIDDLDDELLEKEDLFMKQYRSVIFNPSVLTDNSTGQHPTGEQMESQVSRPHIMHDINHDQDMDDSIGDAHSSLESVELVSPPSDAVVAASVKTSFIHHFKFLDYFRSSLSLREESLSMKSSIQQSAEPVAATEARYKRKLGELENSQELLKHESKSIIQTGERIPHNSVIQMGGRVSHHTSLPDRDFNTNSEEHTRNPLRHPLYNPEPELSTLRLQSKLDSEMYYGDMLDDNDTAHHRVNIWLLDQLRSLPLEALVYKNTIDPKSNPGSLKAANLKETVQNGWFNDDWSELSNSRARTDGKATVTQRAKGRARSFRSLPARRKQTRRATRNHNKRPSPGLNPLTTPASRLNGGRTRSAPDLGLTWDRWLSSLQLL